MKDNQSIEKKVLLIGHNVFDRRTAFGKTLISFFRDWGAQNLAQLYFHSEIPTSTVCDNYFRITDSDVLKNIFKKNADIGKRFEKAEIDEKRSSSRTDTGIKSKIYSLGRKRSPLTYIARNFIWKHANWFSEKLKKWIGDFDPDVIFFAGSDYAFAYDIAYMISVSFDIPIVMYCCDDYYVNRVNPHAILGKSVYKGLMKSVRRCVERTSAMITICDKMTERYKLLFDKPIYTVYTGYSAKGSPCENKKIAVVYLGNLGFNRYESLIDIGKALRELSEETGQDLHLDVYSSENRKKILKKLNEKNGIVFHGSVDSELVKKIISESQLVLHVESFKKKNIYKVEYSVSTKIADLLASGVCIFAYGPDNIASIEYLQDNSAAIVADDENYLKERLKEALSNKELRQQTVIRASELADKNHKGNIVSHKIQSIISLSITKM